MSTVGQQQYSIHAHTKAGRTNKLLRLALNLLRQTGSVRGVTRCSTTAQRQL